jgi:hypothetical protein
LGSSHLSQATHAQRNLCRGGFYPLPSNGHRTRTTGGSESRPYDQAFTPLGGEPERRRDERRTRRHGPEGAANGPCRGGRRPLGAGEGGGRQRVHPLIPARTAALGREYGRCVEEPAPKPPQTPNLPRPCQLIVPTDTSSPTPTTQRPHGQVSLLGNPALRKLRIHLWLATFQGSKARHRFHHSDSFDKRNRPNRIQASGLNQSSPGKRAKSASALHSVNPCSMARAARWASGTRLPVA